MRRRGLQGRLALPGGGGKKQAMDAIEWRVSPGLTPYEEALADVQSAIRFHLETFGNEVFEVESPVLEVFVAETQVTA